MDIQQDTSASIFGAIVGALTAQFGRAAVTPGQALQVLPGTQPKDLEGAANQRIFGGTYPFTLTYVGRRRIVLITSIADALLNGASDVRPQQDRVRRGRPRKKHRLSAEVVALEGGAP